MEQSKLALAINNIVQAQLLERRRRVSLSEVIERIKQAKNKELELIAGSSDSKIKNIRSLEAVIRNIKQAKIQEAKRSAALPEIIKQIKEAFLKYWQEEHLPYVTKVSSAIKKGLPTPVLTVCGRGTQEIRFTRYLAYFLDPHKKHGLKASFLKAVLQQEARGLRTDWFNHCEVVPELWIGNYMTKSGKIFDCYCDIGILGNDYAIIIEQKILSGEDTGGADTGVRQLKRYNWALSHNPEFRGKRIIKLYLTPTGRINNKAGDWRPLSHADLIARALKLFADEGLTLTAKENLRRFLVDLSIGPYQKTEEVIDQIEETTEVLLEGDFNLSALLKFRRLADDNRMMLNALMEGL
jgi:hypothetical protein